MLVFLIFLIYSPFNNGMERIPMLADRDVYHTLFGDIGSMQDLFLKETDEPQATRREAEPANDNDHLDDLDLELPDLFDFNRANLTNHTFDIEDFLTINEQYSNFAKEFKNYSMNNPIKKPKNIQTKDELKNKTRRSYDDPDDWYHSESIEPYKKYRLMMVLAQFALHCRYEVGKALLHREMVRQDKRYKLGYLFNRMRRLKTEQLKQVGAMWRMNWDYSATDVKVLMRSYERVVHYDVDMRDTANLIKTIFNKDEPYDYFVIKTRATERMDDSQKFNFS